jgi:anti-sigma regulatory factor (Ser/Thr protein kinase)
LAREQVTACPQELVDTVALLVTELVTNAVLHARTALVLHIDVHDGVVRLSVSDRSHDVPVLKHYDTDDVTGRGLALVEMLAANWGVDEEPDGKSVWCEVAIPQALDPDGQ